MPRLIPFLCGSLALAGCTMIAASSSSLGIFQTQDANMLARNTAAADYMVDQMRSFIGVNDVIRALPLSDPQEKELIAPISRVVTEQVGLRLIQLGYKVDLQAVSDVNNPSGYEQGPLPSGGNDFMLGGTYERARKDLMVHLRLTENKTGRVVAGFDYGLPYDRKVGEQSTPEPKIMRLSPQGSDAPVESERLP